MSPGPAGSGPRRSWFSSLTNHLALKGTCVVLAVVLWLVWSVREPAQEVIPVSFQPLLDPSLEMVGSVPPLRALVIGRGRELLKLYSTPPTLRKVIRAGVPDSFVVDLQPEDVDIPASVDVIVRDLQPRTVTLRFASTSRRLVPVRSALRLTAGPGLRMIGPAEFEPESVLVSGPRAAVGRLDSVRTVADARDVCDSARWLVRLDTAGLAVSVRPATVQAHIPVVRDSIVRGRDPCAARRIGAAPR